jgi:hypothetical protein
MHLVHGPVGAELAWTATSATAATLMRNDTRVGPPAIGDTTAGSSASPPAPRPTLWAAEGIAHRHNRRRRG